MLKKAASAAEGAQRQFLAPIFARNIVSIHHPLSFRAEAQAIGEESALRFPFNNRKPTINSPKGSRDINSRYQTILPPCHSEPKRSDRRGIPLPLNNQI